MLTSGINKPFGISTCSCMKPFDVLRILWHAGGEVEYDPGPGTQKVRSIKIAAD